MTLISRALCLFAILLFTQTAQAQNCLPNPYNLANGTTADATQVMANFNNLLACANAAPSLASVRGAIGGLQLSNDSGSPNTVLDIAQGTATDSTVAYSMTLPSAFTKSTGSWAVGSGNGALDTGSVAASTWYHVFEIARSDTGVVDILFSLSPTTPTMPTAYNYKRRIGSIATDPSSHIVLFKQYGDQFWLTNANYSYSGTITPGSRSPISLYTPLGIQTEAFITVAILGSSGVTYLTLMNADQAGSPNPGQFDLGTSSAGSFASGRFDVWTSLSSVIYVYVQTTNATIYMNTLGWLDTRERFN